MLRDEYVKRYLGKYLNLGDSINFVELVDIEVCGKDSPIYRHLDYALDALGNQWWIKNELVPAMAAGRILPLNQLPVDAKIISR